MTISIYENVEILAEALATLMLSMYLSSIQSHNVFNVAISGGSLPLILKNERIIDQFWKNNQVDLTKVHIFLVDERCVPLDHEDSNYLAISRIYENFPSNNIHKMNWNCEKSPQNLALDYEQQLKSHFVNLVENGFPKFDLILLGMGPDGHTASLFPNRDLQTDFWVSFITDSPKKPSCRITLSLPVLNAAENVVFVVTGYEKKDMVKSIIVDKNEDVPAGMVKAKNTLWLVDRLAALEITDL